MPDQSYTDLVKLLDEALRKNGTGRDGFCFDNEDSLTALLKKFDRKPIVSSLKAIAIKKDVQAKEWTPLAAQVDFMSVAERDVRLRFRNRIQSMNLRNKTSELGRSSMQTMSSEIEQIQK